MGLVVLLAALAVLPVALCLNNSLAQTPTMGFNTWNAYGPDIDEQLVLQTAGFLNNLTLSKLGYNLIVLDDGWSTKERGVDGRLQADPKKFPSGLKALSDRLAGMGIQLGLFGDAGTRTCGGAAASYGHEELDAQTFASWGISYLKYDNCFAVKKDKAGVQQQFEVMRNALNKTGRPIAYAIDDWGVTNPWDYGMSVANSWRTTAGLVESGEPANWDGIIRGLDNNAGLGRFAGPGGWNNMDFLAIGEPISEELSMDELRSHFALWSIAKSPLFISADLRQITKDTLSVLMADELVAVNQDPLGVPGDLIWKQGSDEIWGVALKSAACAVTMLECYSYEDPLFDNGSITLQALNRKRTYRLRASCLTLQIWGTALKGGARAVAMLNRHFDEDPLFDNSSITLQWHHLGWEMNMPATVRDLYAKKDLGLFTGNFTAIIPEHGVMALKLTPSKYADSFDLWRPWDCGIETDTGAHGVWACFSHTALDRPTLFGYVPVTNTLAAGMGAVIALLAVAVAGLAVGWRLSVTRGRKAYKKWGEEAGQGL